MKTASVILKSSLLILLVSGCTYLHKVENTYHYYRPKQLKAVPTPTPIVIAEPMPDAHIVSSYSPVVKATKVAPEVKDTLKDVKEKLIIIMHEEDDSKQNVP